VKEVVLLPDSDEAGRLACVRATDAYAAQGKTIKVRFPPIPKGKKKGDWNDLLMETVDLAALRKQLETGDFQVVSDQQTEALENMNKNHAFIRNYGRKPAILEKTYSHVYKKYVLDFIQVEPFCTMYCNKFIRLGKKEVPLGKWWVEHPERKEYKAVFFDPSFPAEHEGCLNLWEGLSVVPAKGNWKDILRHIYVILCNRDRSKFIYVIKWLAFMVQNPGKRAETVLIFKGKEGAGKGFIFGRLVEAYGCHGSYTNSAEGLVGRFNAHLAQTVFLLADEANFAGNRAAEGVLKQLISEPKMPVEAKFKDLSATNNFLHIIMCTNQNWVVPAHHDSRRYFINEVDSRYARNECSDEERKNYFDKLYHILYNGGLEAMLFDLMNMQLGDWHPRTAMPSTEEMDRQIVQSLGKMEKTLVAFLNEGRIPGVLQERGVKVKSRSLFDYLDGIDSGCKDVSMVKKAEALKQLGIKKVRHGDGVYWVFPDLSTIRTTWERLHGKFKWDIEGEWHVTGSNY